MRRLLPIALLLLLAAAPPVLADETADDPIPPLATDEEAKAALDAFKEAWSARGLRGDERTAARERAMRTLAAVQHKDVADRLARLSGDRDEDIRSLAVMYLGEQRAIPGYAGPLVVKALETHRKDPIVVLFALESIDRLQWLGATETLESLLKHPDAAVQKVALLTIGDMEEMRLLDAIVKLMQELKIDEGVKWEGGEVHYDTGAAGTHDQEMAEKIYQEKYGNAASQGRKAGRAMRDIKPIVLEAMKRLTGQEFTTTAMAKAWIEANARHVADAQKALEDLESSQRDAARDL
jgi:hypothetical protein